DPMTAASVKTSFERAIRLSREAPPAAFASIEGVAAYLDGKAADVTGIRTPSDNRVEIALHEALPIFPAFLTDGRTSVAAIVAASGGKPEEIFGTRHLQLSH